MAEKLKAKSGTKLQLALDAPVGKEPVFNLVCTFFKSIDESAFLISIPMMGGKAMLLDENQKLLIKFGSGTSAQFIAGYADDIVKDGIRRYWKIRRVSDQRQFFQRADERLKVALRVTYMQDTWALNADGEVVQEDGLTLDISNGGLAMFLNRRFEVGEICQVTMPRVGTTPGGKEIKNMIGVVCWQREAPKGSPFRMICGLQLRFAETADKETYAQYVGTVKKKYAL